MTMHHDLPPYQMSVTRRFLILSVIASCCISFLVGRGTRIFSAFHYRTAWNKVHQGLGMESNNLLEDKLHLPSPMVKGGKNVPHTVYTSKHFDTSRPVTSASLFIRKGGGGEGSESHLETAEEESQPPPPEDVPNEKPNSSNRTHLDSLFSGGEGVESGDSEEELHLPAGQHLLFDFDNVDATFLNSQKQLAEAMVAMVYECGLTMLSYHCFGLQPSGVSCAGVLLESHVAFHTWPEEGVITMDLFTCGATSLLPMVPMIEQLFARPRPTAAAAPPKMIWSYKRRGFSNLNDSQPNYKKRSSITGEASDTFSYPLGVQGVALKKEIQLTTSSDLNEFHVFDVIQEPQQSLAAYETSLSKAHSNSYEYQHAHLFRPDRLVYSQGVLKLRRLGEAAAYESLVHPAMVSHPSPQSVAIIGAGEGAALREVLKYQSVQQVLWIGADPTIVRVARTHLKDWNDCSNLIGSAPSCFDDPRVTVLTQEESRHWFLNTLGGGVLGNNDNNDVFDVVIVDDLFQGFPKTFPNLSTTIETNIEFLTSLYDAVLSDDGIVVIHSTDDGFVGDTPIHSSSDANVRRLHSNDKTLSVSKMLVTAGFPEIREYQETHGGFGVPRNYVVAFKQSSSSSSAANNSDRENASFPNWNDNVAMIELQLKKRTMPTRDGTSPFRYFDGATMSLYRSSHATSTVDATQQSQDDTTSRPLPLGFDTLSLLAPTLTVHLWRNNENMILDDGSSSSSPSYSVSSTPTTTTASTTPTSTTTTWTQNTSRLLSNLENGGLAVRDGSMITLKVQPFKPSTTVDPNVAVCQAAASSSVAPVVDAKVC